MDKLEGSDLEIKYLSQGEQTGLSTEDISDIKENIVIYDTDNKSEVLFKIYERINKFRKGDKKLVGKNTTHDILKNKKLIGCHDYGLLISSILRLFGIPTIMVETVGVDRALKYPDIKEYQGHVFLKIFIDNNWEILDSTTGEIISDIEGEFIRSEHFEDNPNGYFVICEGKDPKDYGVTDSRSLRNKMVEAIPTIKKLKVEKDAKKNISNILN